MIDLTNANLVDNNGDECMKSINKKYVDIVFIFTWKTSLTSKLIFPSNWKIQPLIFVDENKDHIPNEYGKLNFKNIINFPMVGHKL